MFDQARVWLRERKERAAEKRAARAHSEHGHGKFFLLTIPATATIFAAIVEWYWAVLFCIEATGVLDWNYSTALTSGATGQSAWDFSFSAHLPVLLGLLCATAPIVMWSMVWLPVQFSARGSGLWRRGTMIFVGVLANILVIVSGTVVMNYNRQDQVRETLVVEQTAEANRAMLTASVDDLKAELDTLMNHRSTYVATASAVGAVAYERDYVAQARATNDPRLPLIERALGSARRADELREQIRSARASVATAAPAAATIANVQDNVGAGLNAFAQYAEVYRPPFVALICTLVGIFGVWWIVALLERINPRDVLRSGWADESHRIEDKTAEAPIATQPYQQQTVVQEENPETGEKRILVTPKPHWRTLKRGKKTQVEVPPEMLPDEDGVYQDGGNRMASSPAGPIDVEALAQSLASEPEQGDEQQAESENAAREIVPAVDGEGAAEVQTELSDDDILLLGEPPVDAPHVEQNDDNSGEEDQQSQDETLEQTEPRGEPETDPARMIGVAAE